MTRKNTTAQNAFRRVAGKPIPAALFGELAEYNWACHLDTLSFTQKLATFGAAVDQFHALATKRKDPSTLPEREQKRLYSKWLAATMAGAMLAEGLRNHAREDDTAFKQVQDRRSLERSLYYVTEHLTALRAPGAAAWRARNKKIATLPQREMEGFLSRTRQPVPVFTPRKPRRCF